MKRITFGAAFHCVATNLTVYFTFFGLPNSTDIAEHFCVCVWCWLRFIRIYKHSFVCLPAKGVEQIHENTWKRQQQQTAKANKTHHIWMGPPSILNYTTHSMVSFYVFFSFSRFVLLLPLFFLCRSCHMGKLLFTIIRIIKIPEPHIVWSVYLLFYCALLLALVCVLCTAVCKCEQTEYIDTI